MLRAYEKFSAAELRTIRNWRIGVLACYLAVFFALLAFVAIDREIGAWTAQAVQADMTAPKAAPANDATLLTSSINAPYP